MEPLDVEKLRTADPATGLRAVTALHRLAERIEATHVAQAFELMRSVQSMPVPPQPGQVVLDDIIASMLWAAS